MFAMAERSWKGLPEDGSRFAGKLPEKDTEAYQAFSLFEKRMEALAGNKPFPYWRDSFVEWTVFGPVQKDRQEEVRNGLLAGEIPCGAGAGPGARRQSVLPHAALLRGSGCR